MSTQTVVQSFNEVGDNPIGLDKSVTVPVCEGLNVALASFQALYLQYQKHHFVVEGAEFYSLHEFCLYELLMYIKLSQWQYFTWQIAHDISFCILHHNTHSSRHLSLTS